MLAGFQRTGENIYEVEVNMGLFGNDKRDLEQALDGLRINIGANYRFHAGVSESSSVKEGTGKVRAVAVRMRDKGKSGEVEAVARAFASKQIPATAVGLSDPAVELDRQEDLWSLVDSDLPPITGSGPKAEAEQARSDEIAKLRAARDYWQGLLSDLTST